MTRSMADSSILNTLLLLRLLDCAKVETPSPSSTIFHFRGSIDSRLLCTTVDHRICNVLTTISDSHHAISRWSYLVHIFRWPCQHSSAQHSIPLHSIPSNCFSLSCPVSSFIFSVSDPPHCPRHSLHCTRCSFIVVSVPGCLPFPQQLSHCIK